MWTKHISDKSKKDDFEKSIRASTLALGRLLQILEEDEKNLSNRECNVEDFDSPSWAHKQAFLQGQKSQLRKMITCLDFIKGN